MNKYISFFRIRFINGLQYRIAAYAGVATQFAWGFMEIFLFDAFYRANPSAFPMEFAELSSYIWLQQAFLSLFMMWFLDEEIFSAISSGNIAYELARPMNLYNMWFVKNLAIRLSKAVLRCMPILIIAAFLPKPYGMSLPTSFGAFLMFLLTMIMGLLMVVAFAMLIYIATFYTLNPSGIRLIALSLTEFLCGGIVPLPFLPDSLRDILELTPFASMQNLPLRIYSGNISGNEMVFLVILQVVWLIVLVGLGKMWMSKAIKQVVVQGG